MAYERRRPPQVILNGRSFTVESANTEAEKQRGLSGRQSLAPSHAMLFIFDTDSEHCFWMKDMRLSIDIVWLDANNKVAAIEQHVSPQSYPQQYCHEGVRVLELAAGTAARLQLQVGDPADL